MYTELPFIGVIEPLLQKKQRFMRMEARRRKTVLVLAAAVIAFLVVCPLPMRVDGTASVEPVHSATLQPDFDGVIKTVNVREGDQVAKGTVLGTMEDWDARAALAAAQAKRDAALGEMNRALASNRDSEAGVQRVQADFWTAEVTRARERLEHTRLRSPIEGVVATPHIENLVGKHLDAGDVFAEVVDTSRATVDVAVEEKDAALLQQGAKAAVKLDGFPTRTFRGEVQVVSPKGAVEGEERVFYARVRVPNPDGTIRAGMQGRGKVSAGWHPAGYVLFRRVGMWFWTKIWTWIGW
jgi:RND family efflux transporter MFP subunit